MGEWEESRDVQAGRPLCNVHGGCLSVLRWYRKKNKKTKRDKEKCRVGILSSFPLPSLSMHALKPNANQCENDKTSGNYQTSTLQCIYASDLGHTSPLPSQGLE